MSEYNAKRRKFFKTSAALSSVCFVPLSALAHENDGTTGEYQPQFFNADEWEFIKAITDQLIPEDELGGGAIVAGVPEFLDRQMQTEYGRGELFYMSGPYHYDVPATLGYQEQFPPNELYRQSITQINQYLNAQYQKKFHELDETTQLDVMKLMEAGKIPLEGISSSATFFALLWRNTEEGFLSDPQYGGNKNMIGWKLIGFPGARADFMDYAGRSGKPYPYSPVDIAGRRGK